MDIRFRKVNMKNGKRRKNDTLITISVSWWIRIDVRRYCEGLRVLNKGPHAYPNHCDNCYTILHHFPDVKREERLEYFIKHFEFVQEFMKKLVKKGYVFDWMDG